MLAMQQSSLYVQRFETVKNLQDFKGKAHHQFNGIVNLFKFSEKIPLDYAQFELTRNVLNENLKLVTDYLTEGEKHSSIFRCYQKTIATLNLLSNKLENNKTVEIEIKWEEISNMSLPFLEQDMCTKFSQKQTIRKIGGNFSILTIDIHPTLYNFIFSAEISPSSKELNILALNILKERDFEVKAEDYMQPLRGKGM